jgi:hypothetical protein
MQQGLVASPGGIPVQLYVPWDIEADERPENSIAQFADVANVLDVRIFPLNENDAITVWVYWEPLTTTEAPLKGFIHLVGDTNPATGGPLWSQDDHEPQYGRVPTTIWETGKIYRDVYTINVADVPAGNYHLLLGLYEPESNVRIPLADSTDTLNLGSITLP